MQIDSDLLTRLRNNDRTLVKLSLENRRLNEFDIKLLQEALVENTTLTSLNVSYNQIDAAGAAALAQNTTLTSLDVSWNQIGDAGATALAQNTTLTSLDVGGNQIGAAGAAALAQNTTLTSLDVCNNEVIVGETYVQLLQEVIANNRYQQQSRRDHFIQMLVTLARDKANPHSQSLWHRLPPEIILLIFSFIDFRSTQSIGKSRQQVYYCATFILNYICEIKAALQQGNRFTVQEQLNQPLSSATRFVLLFKSVTHQGDESKKHTLEAEKPGAKKKKDAFVLS